MNQAEFEANFDADVLDFNEAHRTRNMSQNERFSITKIRQMLNLEDIERWVNEIQLPNTNNYKYPSSIDLGLIHQQSCYLQPNPEFLKTCKVDKCECCGQFIRKRKISFWSCDMYETLGKEFGLYLPIYFSIQKLNIIILVLLGLLFGGYFCYMSSIVCNDEQFLRDRNDKDENETVKKKIDSCQYQSSTNFIPQELLINYLYEKDNLNGYLWLTYCTFFLILCTPFMHEILIKQRLVQYWDYDINNHRHPSQLTLYIKHLPKKFNEQEIMLYILNAVQHEQKKQPINYSYIDELVYIYDTHPLSEINQQRSKSYLQLLQTALELKESPDNLVNKEKLIDVIQDLMRQTKQIQSMLKSGLPFTSKVIIKFSNETITNKVFDFYYKDLYHKIIGQYKALNKSARDLQRQQALQLKLEMQVSHSEITPGQSVLKQTTDIGYLARSSSIDMEQALSQPKKKNDVMFSLAELINFNQVDLVPPSPSPLLTHEEMQKDLHMQRGFSQDDIFWENMGMNTLKRLILRIETTTITIVAGVLSMLLFMWMFYEEQVLKASDKSGFIVNLVVMTMVVVIMGLSVMASIIVIKMTVGSKRSTYSLQEKNMITFMGPIQQLCIISFPYFLALSYPEADGVINSMPIYTIYFLAQIRIIFKGLIHIIHLRAMGYYFTKKKIMKKFNPNLYFQKQLNDLLTPGQYPIRSRVLYQFFIFSTGLLMMFLAPFINLFCVVFLVFFYFFDKYCLLHVYTIDKQFTYQLLNYLVITYQVIMIPIYCYVYIVIFSNKQIVKMAGSQWQYMGYGTGAVCFIVYVTLRKKLAHFWVYKICRYSHPIQNPSKFNEKSYFQSYNDYFDSLGVEELNQLLITTFKSMQYSNLSQPE